MILSNLPALVEATNHRVGGSLFVCPYLLRQAAAQGHAVAVTQRQRENCRFARLRPVPGKNAQEYLFGGH